MFDYKQLYELRLKINDWRSFCNL